mmetsp:Transcript_7678/g.25979  ORF Transcript_7678/g.25979 Transcript_7678/m.25979 type:complete len:224 (+) Transcript_7678:158-829(+)
MNGLHRDKESRSKLHHESMRRQGLEREEMRISLGRVGSPCNLCCHQRQLCSMVHPFPDSSFAETHSRSTQVREKIRGEHARKQVLEELVQQHRQEEVAQPRKTRTVQGPRYFDDSNSLVPSFLREPDQTLSQGRRVQAPIEPEDVVESSVDSKAKEGLDCVNGISQHDSSVAPMDDWPAVLKGWKLVDWLARKRVTGFGCEEGQEHWEVTREKIMHFLPCLRL